MRVLILGDTHIHNHAAMGGQVISGINERCMDLVRCILTVIEKAKRQGVTAVLQLGDFFDNAKPTPAVTDLAMEMIKASNVDWYILAGNHDVSAFGAPTAIRPLAHLPNVRIFEEAEVVTFGSLLCQLVPYTKLRASEAIGNGNASVHTVFMHYGLHVELGSPSPDYVTAKQLAKLYPRAYDSYHGHEHTWRRHNHGSFRSYNLGSFADYTFSGNSGSVSAILDTDHPSTFRSMGNRSPGFYTPDDLTLDYIINTMYKHESLYVRVKKSQSAYAKTLKEAGLICDFVVMPDVAQPADLSTIEVPEFEVSEPATDVAQVILSGVETGKLSEDRATRLIGLMQEHIR